MLIRAYSLMTVKQIDEDERVIEGVASTPEPDRLGDIVEPDGAEFKLPLPLLWQHNSREPVGQVTKATVTKDGIPIVAKFAKLEEPGRLKDRLDEAWQSIKIGLVQGLSIGFRAIERSFIEDSFSIRFLRWEWIELSAVTIPANSEATITAVKALDIEQMTKGLQAVSGDAQHLHIPGVPGKSRVVRLADAASEPQFVVREIRRLRK